jgi:hypothetical protein
MRILFEDDKIPGTRLYAGKTIAEIAAVDPKYLRNFQRTSSKYAISDEVMRKLQSYKLRQTTKPGIELSKSSEAVRRLS